MPGRRRRPSKAGIYFVWFIITVTAILIGYVWAFGVPGTP